jgi:hypothetical protein
LFNLLIQAIIILAATIIFILILTSRLKNVKFIIFHHHSGKADAEGDKAQEWLARQREIQKDQAAKMEKEKKNASVPPV